MGKVVILGLDVLGGHRVVLFGPGLAHDAQLGQLVQQHGVGPLQHDVDGVGIDLDHLVDALGKHGVVGGLGHRTVDREDHVLWRHHGAVTELDTACLLYTSRCV